MVSFLKRGWKMDLEAIKHLLERKLDQITDRARRIEMELRDPGSKDSQERAIESENQEVLERLNEAERAEIQEIRAALARIDAGTYQVCSRCGGEIAAKRLEALPYTGVCVSCSS